MYELCSLDKWVSNEFRLESNEWPLKKRDLSNEYAPVQIHIYISTNQKWRPWRSRSFEIHSNSIQNRGGFFWKILSPLRFIVFLIPLAIKVIPKKYFHPTPSNLELFVPLI